MKARSTFTVLWTTAVVPLFAAAILLGFPSLTHDSGRDGATHAAPRPASGPAEAATSPIAVASTGRTAASAGGEETRATIPATTTGVADRPPAPGSPTALGMVIGIDPETGALGMPTLEQQRELSNMERVRLEDSQGDLVPVFHTDGSISLDLKGRFQEFATVRIDPSGKKSFRCVDGKENAERAIAGPSLETAAESSPAAPVAEER